MEHPVSDINVAPLSFGPVQIKETHRRESGLWESPEWLTELLKDLKKSIIRRSASVRLSQTTAQDADGHGHLYGQDSLYLQKEMARRLRTVSGGGDCRQSREPGHAGDVVHVTVWICEYVTCADGRDTQQAADGFPVLDVFQWWPVSFAEWFTSSSIVFSDCYSGLSIRLMLPTKLWGRKTSRNT